MTPANPAYLEMVCTRMAEAIQEACDHVRPAALKLATGEAKGKIAYNSYAPQLYDPRCHVIQVVDEAGRSIATLVNYAIHPEVLGSDRGVLSPDLCGPLYDRIATQGGGTAIFFNSAQGGMVTADVRRSDGGENNTWEECVRIGELLAALVRQLPGADQAMEVDAVRTRLNVVNLGNAQILTIPGEALPNIGYYLKRKMAGKHNFLFGLTNDAYGYLLARVDYASFPRYEYITRTSLGEMAGEVFVEEALRLALENP